MEHRSITILFFFITGLLSGLPYNLNGQTTFETQCLKFNYTDIENYANLVPDLFNGTDGMKERWVASYISKASEGLQRYIERQNTDSEKLLETIFTYPDYYKSLLDIKTDYMKEEWEIIKAVADFKKLYPDINCPTVYYFIGGMRAGGLNDPAGLLISADMYGLTGNTSKAKLGVGNRNLYKRTDLSHLVIHEFIHHQQLNALGLDTYKSIYRENKPLLAISIREGIADFITALLTGKHINEEAHLYGDRHEEELWREFKKDMQKKGTGEWMWVKPSDKDKPQDLGYFMGYKIAESFYKQTKNKKSAISRMITLTKYDSFLHDSKYSEKFE